ncbi:MAG: radical SAM protein [Methanoregula sp.]
MKILFIYPNITQQEGLSPAIAYLSGYLKRCGHDVILFDFTWTKNINNCIDTIRKFQPDIIGFTSTTLDFPFCLKILESIKKAGLMMPIIFGGVHPTVAPDETLSNQNIDMICVGEGELAMAELLGKMQNGESIDNIQNIWIKKDYGIIKNPVRNLIENLDELYFDREIFDFERYFKSRGNIVDIFAGRGCPYKCTYCINHVQQKIYQGKGQYVRLRTVDNILEEIISLQKKYDIKGIVFPDDTFTFNKKWVELFCEEYSKKVRIPFSCNGRIENINTELCKSLKNAGCNSIMFGVECGSEKLRKELLRRNLSDEQIISAFKQVKEENILTFSYNMVGFPYETIEDIKQTVELNKKIQPDEIQCTIFFPFPGTELHEICRKNGWITDKKIIDYNSKSILQYDHISPEEIKRERDNFSFNVFYDYNKLKAYRSLIMGKYYNLYSKIRGKLPLLLRSYIQKCTNTIYFKTK